MTSRVLLMPRDYQIDASARRQGALRESNEKLNHSLLRQQGVVQVVVEGLRRMSEWS